MGRIARAVAVGCAHHVTQRGNFRRDVFFDDLDRSPYLELLTEASAEHGLKIWCHCLMSNHVHLIVVPEKCDSMATAFRVAYSAYSRWLNIRLRRCGHVWQNRYFSCALDPAYLVYAMRYVESNPGRAGMVDSVLDYEWSSARVHAGLEEPPGCLDVTEWGRRYPSERWKEVLGLGFRV